MKGKIAVLVMVLLLLLYLVLVGQRAVLLMATGEPIGIVMGAVLVVLPFITAWLISREILFGVRTERLVRILDEEGALPVEELPRRASGRPLRDAADAEFPRYRREVEADPGAWRAWFRLGLAYDASGDRRRARAALRESIRLYRSEASSAPSA